MEVVGAFPHLLCFQQLLKLFYEFDTHFMEHSFSRHTGADMSHRYFGEQFSIPNAVGHTAATSSCASSPYSGHTAAAAYGQRSPYPAHTTSTAA